MQFGNMGGCLSAAPELDGGQVPAHRECRVLGSGRKKLRLRTATPESAAGEGRPVGSLLVSWTGETSHQAPGRRGNLNPAASFSSAKQGTAPSRMATEFSKNSKKKTCNSLIAGRYAFLISGRGKEPGAAHRRDGELVRWPIGVGPGGLSAAFVQSVRAVEEQRR